MNRQVSPYDYEFRKILLKHQKREKRKQTIEEYAAIILAALGCGFLLLWALEVI